MMMIKKEWSYYLYLLMMMVFILFVWEPENSSASVTPSFKRMFPFVIYYHDVMYMLI